MTLQITWPSPSVKGYEYTQQDRITNPHKYSFSPFGDQFFESYKQDREKWIGQVSKAISDRRKPVKAVSELSYVISEHKTSEQLRLIIQSVLEVNSSSDYSNFD